MAAETRFCPYCKSPIPAGWEKCKSCSMSGEFPRKPDGARAAPPAQGSSRATLVVLALLLLAAVAAGVYYVHGLRARREAPAGK